MNHACGTPRNAIMLPRIKIRGYKTKPSLRLCKKKKYFVGLQQFQSGVYIIVAGWWTPANAGKALLKDAELL